MTNKVYLFFFCWMVWMLCVVVLLVSDKSSHEMFTGTDFRPQYTAITMSNHGITNDFYSLDTQFKWQKKVTPELVGKQRLLPFISTPVGVAILKPLGYFSIETAYRIWGFLNIILMLIICRLLISIYTEKKQDNRAINSYELAILVVSFFPVWFSIWQAQFSLIYTFVFIASYVLIQKKRYFYTGLLLTLLAIKPHLVALPFILFVWKRDWEIVKGMLCGFVFWAAVSVWLVGVAGIAAYIKLITAIPAWGDQMGITPQIQPTIKGFLHNAFNTTLLTQEMTMLWLGLCVLAVAYLFHIWRTARPGHMRDLQWAWLIIVLIAISPHTHFHDLSMLLLPLTLWLKYLFRSGSKSRIGTFISKYRPTKILLFLIILFTPLILRQLAYLPGMVFTAFLVFDLVKNVPGRLSGRST